MANTLAALTKCSGTFLGHQLNNALFQRQYILARNLFSATALGVDRYIEHRQRVGEQLRLAMPTFREKMKEFLGDGSTTMVFTEDLKNMVHVAESDEDVELVAKMLKKFNAQNKELRFGHYVFGPVVMRMFYHLNKPDEALECFKSADAAGFFDQLGSFQLLLDLLYENGRYEDMLEVYMDIKSRMVQGTKYPRNSVVLILAACYKLNTPESWKYAQELWMEMVKAGHEPMRRAYTFCAALAIRQGSPQVALEILFNTKRASYTTIRNLKVLALTELNRLDETIPILKSILIEDTVGAQRVIHTFNKEVIDKVQNAIEKSGNDDLTLQFQNIMKYFRTQGHIAETTLEENLCTEIEAPVNTWQHSHSNNYPQNRRPFYDDHENNQRFSKRDGQERSNRQQFRRPGLADMR